MHMMMAVGERKKLPSFRFSTFYNMSKQYLAPWGFSANKAPDLALQVHLLNTNARLPGTFPYNDRALSFNDI